MTDIQTCRTDTWAYLHARHTHIHGGHCRHTDRLASTYTYTHTAIHTYHRTYTDTYICTDIQTYTPTHIHTDIHTHTHIERT